MQQNFEYNLSKVLAYTVVYEARQQAPKGEDYRNEGDERAPSPRRQAKELAVALDRLVGPVSEQFREQILPTEQAILAAEQAVSPQYAELNRQLLAQNLPAISQAELGAIQGPGGDVVRATSALGREIDPQFYAARDAIGSLLGTATGVNQDILQNPLTGGEISGIERGLNRLNLSRGTFNAPSNLGTISSGLTFGTAARDRLTQALNSATGLTQAGTGFLGAARSIPDVKAAAAPNPFAAIAALGTARQPEFAGSSQLALTGQVLGEQAAGQRLGIEADASRRAGYEKVFGSLPDY